MTPDHLGIVLHECGQDELRRRLNDMHGQAVAAGAVMSKEGHRAYTQAARRIERKLDTP